LLDDMGSDAVEHRRYQSAPVLIEQFVCAIVRYQQGFAILAVTRDHIEHGCAEIRGQFGIEFEFGRR
jgi:hypothetical protein